MKNAFSIWLRRWQFPLLLLLSVMPIGLTLLSLHAPQALFSAYLLFGAYAVLSGVCLAVPASKRLCAGIVSCALMTLMTPAVLSVRAYPLFLLLPAALSALLLYSLPLAARRYESDVPPYIYVTGILIHSVIQFLHQYFARVSGGSPYEPVSTALTVSLVGYIVLLLLSMNRISLDNATLARHRLPASMRRFNTLLTLGFIALSLLLSVIPAVASTLRMLFHLLTTTIVRFSSWLLSLLPEAPPVEGGASGGMPGLPGMALETTEPSFLAQLMETIVSAFSTLLFVGGSLFLLYRIAVLLLRLLRHVLGRLRMYVSAASTDYDDEITDTREDGAARESRFVRRARRQTAFDPTPAGRIRQTYARLLRRNPKWTDSSTARENLPEQAAALYERTRYSEHPITGEDAERFAAEIKKSQEKS